MKNKKHLIFSSLLLLFSVMLLIASTLAWIVARPSQIDRIVITTGKLEMEVTLEYSYNGLEYQRVTNDLTMANIIPGDYFDFRLTVINKSNINGLLTVHIDEVTSSIINGYNMATMLMLTCEQGNIYNKSIAELLATHNNFMLLSDQLIPREDAYIYNFQIVFNSQAGNEYQNQYLRIGKIVVRLDQI